MKTILVGMILIFIVTFDVDQPIKATRLFLIYYGLLAFIFVSSGRVLIRNIQPTFLQKDHILCHSEPQSPFPWQQIQSSRMENLFGQFDNLTGNVHIRRIQPLMDNVYVSGHRDKNDLL